MAWHPRAILKYQRELQLASDQRAGAWNRAQIVRQRREFILWTWPVVIIPPLGAVAFTPLLLLLPQWCRGIGLGVILTSGVWGSIMVVVTLSGTVPRAMGEMAEQWTARELRRLRKRGWHLANGLLLKEKSDIDHVLIGPGGVLVMETKYSSDDWDRGDFSAARIRGAVVQVNQNRARVAGVLSRNVDRQLIQSAVVLWGGSAESTYVTDDAGHGVAIVPGGSLRAWLESIEDIGLDEASIGGAWKTVSDHIARRDKADLELSGPPPRGLLPWFLVLSGVALIAMSGLGTELVILRVTGTVWFVPVGAGLAGLAWIARRLGLDRRWWLSWLIGTQIMTVLLIIAYLVSAVLRLVQ